MPDERFYKLHQSTLDRLKKLKLNARYVFILMCLRADAAEGTYRGCADSISDQCDGEITPRVAQEILANLDEKGLIRRFRNEATRGRYKIALEGYEVTVGEENKGRRVCVAKSGTGLHGEVAYVGATGKTEEEECDEPTKPTPAVVPTPLPVVAPVIPAPAVAVATVARHPMTERTNEIFAKLEKKTGDKALKSLDKYLSENPHVADDFEEVLAFAVGHWTKEFSWNEQIYSIESLVWRLNSTHDRSLLVQFYELRPNQKLGYMKMLKKKLGVQDIPVERPAARPRKTSFGFTNVVDL